MPCRFLRHWERLAPRHGFVDLRCGAAEASWPRNPPRRDGFACRYRRFQGCGMRVPWRGCRAAAATNGFERDPVHCRQRNTHTSPAGGDSFPPGQADGQLITGDAYECRLRALRPVPVAGRSVGCRPDLSPPAGRVLSTAAFTDSKVNSNAAPELLELGGWLSPGDMAGRATRAVGTRERMVLNRRAFRYRQAAWRGRVSCAGALGSPGRRAHGRGPRA